MAEMVASAATGVMGSAIEKLAAILTEKHQLARNVEHGIRFLKNELGTMDAVVQKLEEKNDDQMNPMDRDLRSKVRELSYDIEDCIDRFMLNRSHGGRGPEANFLLKAVQRVKTLLQDQRIAEEIQQLKSLVIEQSQRCDRYGRCLIASPKPVHLDPRAPALFLEGRDLVGIHGPREEIIQLLKADDKQHKVVCIYGTAGQGKTTLAMEVYRKISEAFDCRAFMSVSQTPDMKRLLRDILSQINKSEFNKSQSWETEQLIRTIREYLTDKRYFILIDDIWNISDLEIVQSALPCNDNGSRIITTTRSKTVAKSCCAGIDAQMYEAKPLSDDDSQTLFFKRLFSSTEDCPQELKKVSADILRKCGGLPLAIISIASLLANRSQTVEIWVSTLKSISAPVEKDSPIDKMKRIFLLSYYDLPHHLKSCLLYLSVFPEDYQINCERLIVAWVAEGLIPGQNRESMEQLGRSYLNELINRSLVQPTKVGVDGTTVKAWRVHDVIFDFIVSKAVEDNFVTIWKCSRFSENYHPSNKIRRLSIQEDISGRAEELARKLQNEDHIRSINIFGSNSVLVKHASEFLSSQVLRVLNIEGEVEECYLGHAKRFGQLKYMRIANYSMDCTLPEDLEKLQYLETLDVRLARLKKVPASIIHLQKLVRLIVHPWVQLPDEIGNLRALEELSMIDLGLQSAIFIHGLGDLANLRVLGIQSSYYTIKVLKRGIDVEDHSKACISSLSNLLTSLRELKLWARYPYDTLTFIDRCVLTPPLQKLVLRRCKLSSVAHQICSLVNLTRLKIYARGEASKEGINVLASLPKLLSLTVSLDYEEGDSAILYQRHAIRGQGFQRLLKFTFWYATALEFEPGAMPKLQRLKLQLAARYRFKCGQGGLVLGLQNLACLKHANVDITCDAAAAHEVDALEDDIRREAGAHPSRPILQVERKYQDLMAPGASERPL